MPGGRRPPSSLLPSRPSEPFPTLMRPKQDMKIKFVQVLFFVSDPLQEDQPRRLFVVREGADLPLDSGVQLLDELGLEVCKIVHFFCF